MPVQAALDIGSNSIKLLVVEIDDDGPREILDQMRVTRLAEGLGASGRLDPAAMARNLDAVARFVVRARELGAAKIAAAGTMALRQAANSAEFVDAVQRRCGLRIEILSGDEEANLAYLGVAGDLEVGEGPVCVLDSGGASTEFIFAAEGVIDGRASLALGSRQASEEWLRSDPPDPGELARLHESCRRSFAALDCPAGRLVGVGGTVTTLAAVAEGAEGWEPKRLSGTILEREELESQIARYAACDLAARRRIAGLPPERADVILAGAAIVAAAMDRMRASSLTVSHKGLRHGLIHHSLSGGTPGPISDSS